MRNLLSIFRALLMAVLIAVGPIPSEPIANQSLTIALLDKRRFPSLGLVITLPFSGSFACSCCNTCTPIPFDCLDCPFMNPNAIASVNVTTSETSCCGGSLDLSVELPNSGDGTGWHPVPLPPFCPDPDAELYVRVFSAMCNCPECGGAGSGSFCVYVSIENIPSPDGCCAVAQETGQPEACCVFSSDALSGTISLKGPTCDHGDAAIGTASFVISPIDGCCCRNTDGSIGGTGLCE